MGALDYSHKLHAAVNLQIIAVVLAVQGAGIDDLWINSNSTILRRGNLLQDLPFGCCVDCFFFFCPTLKSVLG